MSNNSGILYVVATPIGNLGDMTPRAVETLKNVDQIAVEDSRHSAPLLRHFGINTPTISYHDHSDNQRAVQLLNSLAAGQSVALISDAGTPLISDPGYKLVAAARAQNIEVQTVPGACALIAALSVAGLPTDRFTFIGFLPHKNSARVDVFRQYQSETHTVVMYESSHRILASLQDMLAVYGPGREIVLARELTKRFETVKKAALGELVSWVEQDPMQQKGEFVLMLRGAEPRAQEIDAEVARLLGALKQELPLKKACAVVAKVHGLKKNELYQWSIDHLAD